MWRGATEDVGELKTYRQEEITDIVGNIHRQSHVTEMEPITQPYQSQGDDMMAHEFLEIPARLFEHQAEHNGLLGPVARLQQVIGLEDPLVGAVREGLVHARRVEVPDWRAVHDPQAVGTEDGKVDGGIRLFHESILLGAAESIRARQRPKQALHDKLACEGENDNVEGDECEVLGAFAVMDGGFWISADVCGD